MPIEFQTVPPSQEQYSALFETTGWNREYHATPDELGQALVNSQFVVSAYDGQELVGVGRVLTDGVLHAMIYDMIVLPRYQHRGIGTRILQQIIHWCEAAGIRDIQLFCAEGKSSFYEKNGFHQRPADAPGMQYGEGGKNKNG